MLREMIKEALCISFRVYLALMAVRGMTLSNTLLAKLWTSWNV